MVLSTEEGSMSRRTARVLAPPLAPCSSSARTTCWHRGGAPTRGPSAQLRSAAQLAAKPVVGFGEGKGGHRRHRVQVEMIDPSR